MYYLMASFLSPRDFSNSIYRFPVSSWINLYVFPLYFLYYCEYLSSFPVNYNFVIPKDNKHKESIFKPAILSYYASE